MNTVLIIPAMSNRYQKGMELHILFLRSVHVQCFYKMSVHWSCTVHCITIFMFLSAVTILGLDINVL